MNKHDPMPKAREASLFKSNRSQAVRIPKDLAFPDGVKAVSITRTEDGGLLLSPIERRKDWAAYFAQPTLADPDFLENRMQGDFEEREEL